MTWTRRDALCLVGSSGYAALAGCQASSGSTDSDRHLVELRNYADQSTKVKIQVYNRNGSSLWKYENELDRDTAVDELFTGTPSKLEITLGDWKERTITWKRIDCDGKEPAPTIGIVYGANTSMDSSEVSFRCEDLDAKYPE